MGILDGLGAPVAKLLGTFGQSVTYRYYRVGAYDVETQTRARTATTATIPALVEDYAAYLTKSAATRDEGGVARGDKRVTVAALALSASNIPTPTTSDEVQIGGTWYRVLTVDAQYGTTSALYYLLQVRR